MNRAGVVQLLLQWSSGEKGHWSVESVCSLVLTPNFRLVLCDPSSVSITPIPVCEHEKKRMNANLQAAYTHISMRMTQFRLG